MKLLARYALFLATFVVAALSQAQAPPQEVEVSPANKLYLQAVAESENASKLERRGKLEPATHAYELAGRLSEASIAEAERTGVAEQGRPPQVYFLCATSYLHAGRLLGQMKSKDRDEQRLDTVLDKAARLLTEVEKIEAERAQKANSALNPEIWRVRNASAYVHFLRGELAQARVAYTSVLEMNPTYKPAELAIVEINKIERRENELFSPQGRTMDKENRRKAVKEVVSTLRLVRDIVTLGR